MSTPVPPPVQASDPARLTNGQVVPRQVVEMPTGGAFTVDLERAPQTLRDLTAARDELIELVSDAQRLGKVAPGSNDDVSRDAATLLGAVADGGSGSLVKALQVGIERLTSLIDSIVYELRAYGDADGLGRDGFDATRA